MALIEAQGRIVLVLDSSHAHSEPASFKPSRRCASSLPDVQLLAGNVATAEGAKALIDARRRRRQGGHRAGLDLHDAGRDRRRHAASHGDCRMQPGRRDEHGVPVVADGGIKFSGDVAKAIWRLWRALGDDRIAFRRHRGEPRGDDSLPGPNLQGLSGNGVSLGDEPKGSRRAILPGRATPACPSSCRRASKAWCPSREVFTRC